MTQNPRHSRKPDPRDMEAFWRQRFEKQQRNARNVQRLNGRLLLYLLAPLLAVSPLLAPRGSPWQLVISIPLAAVMAWYALTMIRQGKQPPVTAEQFLAGATRRGEQLEREAKEARRSADEE